MEIDGNWVENTPRYLSKLPIAHTLQQPKTPLDTPKQPQAPPNTLHCLPGKALATSEHSLDSLRGIWVVKGWQGGLWEKWDVSDDVC